MLQPRLPGLNQRQPAGVQLRPSAGASPQAAACSIHRQLEAVLEEARDLLQGVSNEAVQAFIERILEARAVFFSAQGRSGFVLRCFCMRLMHLGCQVYYCGETITPAIEREDLLVVLSGSGETASTLEAVRTAKARDCATFGIVGEVRSRIGSLVDECIHLPGTSKLRRADEPESVQPAGSLFEQAAFLLLEAVILTLHQRRPAEVDGFSPRHAVIE